MDSKLQELQGRPCMTGQQRSVFWLCLVTLCQGVILAQGWGNLFGTFLYLLFVMTLNQRTGLWLWEKYAWQGTVTGSPAWGWGSRGLRQIQRER